MLVLLYNWLQPGAIDHSSLFPVSLPFGCSSYDNTSGKLSGEGGFGITFISAKQLLLVLLGQDRTTLNTLVLLTVSAESLPHRFLPSGSSPQGFTRAKDPLFWVLMETRSSLIQGLGLKATLLTQHVNSYPQVQILIMLKKKIKISVPQYFSLISKTMLCNSGRIESKGERATFLLF